MPVASRWLMTPLVLHRLLWLGAGGGGWGWRSFCVLPRCILLTCGGTTSRICFALHIGHAQAAELPRDALVRVFDEIEPPIRSNSAGFN